MIEGFSVRSSEKERGHMVPVYAAILAATLAIAGIMKWGIEEQNEFNRSRSEQLYRSPFPPQVGGICDSVKKQVDDVGGAMFP